LLASQTTGFYDRVEILRPGGCDPAVWQIRWSISSGRTDHAAKLGLSQNVRTRPLFLAQRYEFDDFDPSAGLEFNQDVDIAVRPHVTIIQESADNFTDATSHIHFRSKQQFSKCTTPEGT